MSYQREVWHRTKQDWLKRIKTHLIWHSWVVLAGTAFGLWLARRLRIPTLSLAEWILPVAGALAALVLLCLASLLLVRARTPAQIYAELVARITTLVFDYKATHPQLDFAKIVSGGDSLSLSIRNSGSAAEFRVLLSFVEGSFQPPVHGGPFFARWPNGNDHMVIPKGSTLSLTTSA